MLTRQSMKTIHSRSKTILSGDNGDVMVPKESKELFWSELVRLATGSYTQLSCGFEGSGFNASTNRFKASSVQ